MRVNDRFQIEDAGFADMLWETTALKELVMNGRIDEDDGDGDVASKEKILRLWGGQPLGLNSNIRVYRYSNGQFFAQHCMSLSLSFSLYQYTYINKQTTTPTP